MAKIGSWVHFHRSVLKSGRLTVLEKEEGSEADPEENPGAEKKEQDPSEPLLKPIIFDKKVYGDLPAWSVRIYGDQTLYCAANPLM